MSGGRVAAGVSLARVGRGEFGLFARPVVPDDFGGAVTVIADRDVIASVILNDGQRNVPGVVGVSGRRRLTVEAATSVNLVPWDVVTRAVNLNDVGQSVRPFILNDVGIQRLGLFGQHALAD